MSKLDEMIREVHAEIWMRQSVYPKSVMRGKMLQSKADEKIALMVAVADLLEDMRRHLQGNEQS